MDRDDLQNKILLYGKLASSNEERKAFFDEVANIEQSGVSKPEATKEALLLFISAGKPVPGAQLMALQAEVSRAKGPTVNAGEPKSQFAARRARHAAAGKATPTFTVDTDVGKLTPKQINPKICEVVDAAAKMRFVPQGFDKFGEDVERLKGKLVNVFGPGLDFNKAASSLDFGFECTATAPTDAAKVEHWKEMKGVLIRAMNTAVSFMLVSKVTNINIKSLRSLFEHQNLEKITGVLEWATTVAAEEGTTIVKFVKVISKAAKTPGVEGKILELAEKDESVKAKLSPQQKEFRNDAAAFLTAERLRLATGRSNLAVLRTVFKAITNAAQSAIERQAEHVNAMQEAFDIENGAVTAAQSSQITEKFESYQTENIGKAGLMSETVFRRLATNAILDANAKKLGEKWKVPLFNEDDKVEPFLAFSDGLAVRAVLSGAKNAGVAVREVVEGTLADKSLQSPAQTGNAQNEGGEVVYNFAESFGDETDD